MKSTQVFTYTVIFQKAEEGGYIAHVPSLPGCMTQGETFEETEENVKQAISLYLEVLAQDGDEIPLEGTDTSLRPLPFP